MNKKLFICLFIFLFSCSNENSNEENLTLPPISERGANTFGCYINDFLLIPRDADEISYNQNGVPFGKGIKMEGDYYNSDNTFSWRQFTVVNYKNKKNYYSIRFKLPNFPNMFEGSYIWGDSEHENEIVVMVFYTNSQTNEHQIYISNDSSGILHITKKDNSSSIFAGTFNGTLKNQDGTKQIEIKEGRFDMNLRTVNNHFFP